MASHSRPGISADRFLELALELPEVIETLMYRELVLKRGDRFMLRPMVPGERRLEGYEAKNPDAGVFAVSLTWEKHDELLSAPDSIYFKRPHYEGYAVLLVDSSDLTEEAARELVRFSWEAAVPKARKPRGKKN